MVRESKISGCSDSSIPARCSSRIRCRIKMRRSDCRVPERDFDSPGWAAWPSSSTGRARSVMVPTCPKVRTGCTFGSRMAFSCERRVRLQVPLRQPLELLGLDDDGLRRSLADDAETGHRLFAERLERCQAGILVVE